MQLSPKEYNIDENNGKYTKSILENKIYGFDFEDEDYQKILKDMKIQHSFSDSLICLMCEKHYIAENKKTPDICRQIRTFINNALSFLHEEYTISDKTLKRWLNDECRPDNTQKSRENLFMLMFALKSTLTQTVKFFQKACYMQPFNFRNINECIFYWCLKNNETWQTVQEMKRRITEQQKEFGEIQPFDGQTIIIGKNLDELVTKEEAILYIARNIPPEDNYFHTAQNLFCELLNEAKEIAKQYTDERIYDKEDSLSYRKQKNSVDFLLSVIFGTKEKIHPKKDWNNLIRENFPAKEQFSRCFRGDVKNADLLRKSLLLLMFFITYVESFETELDEFVSNVDYHLEECGFPLLYPANPYDRIFLLCVLNDNPLDYFRDIFSEEDEEK